MYSRQELLNDIHSLKNVITLCKEEILLEHARVNLGSMFEQVMSEINSKVPR